jgi:hypothetical protein
MEATAGTIFVSAQYLHGSELRAGDGDGCIDNFAVKRQAVLLRDQINANGVQQLDVGRVTQGLFGVLMTGDDAKVGH